MDQNMKNYKANMDVLENFKKDPIYKGYWENWNRAQKWMQNCEQTFQDFQRNLECTVEIDVDENTEDDRMEFNNDINEEHKKEMAEKRRQQKEEEAKLPEVEFINATDIGIHGINSAEIDRPSFRSRMQEHLKEMEELYGPEAERIITRESTINFKFDQLISQFGPSLWPQIPFRL